MQNISVCVDRHIVLKLQLGLYSSKASIRPNGTVERHGNDAVREDEERFWKPGDLPPFDRLFLLAFGSCLLVNGPRQTPALSAAAAAAAFAAAAAAKDTFGSDAAHDIRERVRARFDASAGDEQRPVLDSDAEEAAADGERCVVVDAGASSPRPAQPVEVEDVGARLANEQRKVAVDDGSRQSHAGARSARHRRQSGDDRAPVGVDVVTLNFAHVDVRRVVAAEDVDAPAMGDGGGRLDGARQPRDGERRIVVAGRTEPRRRRRSAAGADIEDFDGVEDGAVVDGGDAADAADPSSDGGDAVTTSAGLQRQSSMPHAVDAESTGCCIKYRISINNEIISLTDIN